MIRKIALIITAALFAGCASVKTGTVVLAVDSSACTCVKNRCVNMETEMKKFMAVNNYQGVIVLDVYDKAKNSETVKVMDKYKMGYFPYLVFTDKTGAVIYSASASEFNKGALNEVIKKAIAAEEVK
ncbi:MAG: hypothetical protein JXR81_05515 [Candidatus Goldbacteria bacterium]|nr:hypothetical protein [Candidatus Goldiibacteriota bacterium]